MRLLFATSLFFSLLLTQQHLIVHHDGHAHQSCSTCQTLSHFPVNVTHSLDFIALTPILFFNIEFGECFQKANTISVSPVARGPPLLS